MSDGMRSHAGAWEREKFVLCDKHGTHSHARAWERETINNY